MSGLGLALVLGLSGGAPDLLPSRSEAEAALLYTMSCRDEDGFTLCDPSIPVGIEFTRFECASEPVAREAERARANCRIEGRVRYTGRRPGEYRWMPLSLDRAGFWLPKPLGAHDMTRWQADS